MKPTAPSVKVHSTMDGEKRAMSIDSHALQHIMSVLTDLYSDPAMAVLREYSTNGYDAIIEAGVNEPLRVTSPTSLAPSLVIEDFGVGMSTDTILNRYSMYGHSTKRDTDAQVGMLGVGCKSGLTYASSFTVKSVHNGIETLAMVSRNTQGIGEIQIIDTKATSRRTGTTITIPVHDIHQMKDKIKTLFSYWTPGSVLVDGKVPATFQNIDGEGSGHKWYTNDDSTIYYRHSEYGGSSITVVMGNVPYRMEDETIVGSNRSAFGYYGHIVVFAPIGSVAFAPSREELAYSGPTLTFQKELRERIQTMKDNIVTQEMSKATTKDEALRAALSLSELSFMNLTTVKWNGKDVPVTQHPFRFGYVTEWSTSKPGWGSAPWSRASSNPWGRMDSGAIVLVNCPTQVGAPIKHRIVAKYGEGQTFYFVNADGTDLPYYGWVEMEDWATFLANLPKLPKAPKVSNGGWVSTAVNDGREWLGEKSYGDVVDGKGKYVIIDTDTLNSLQESYAYSLFRKRANALGYTPVRVYSRSKDAFVEMANEAVTYEVFERRFQKAANDLTEDQRNAFYLINDLSNSIPTDRWSELLDSRFSDLLESVKDADEGVWKADGKRPSRKLDRWPDKDYPMLDTYNVSVEGRIEYLNALYTYRTGKDAK